MYICICNGIRESELQRLGREGVRDPRKALARFGCEPQCESCLEEVQAVLFGGSVFPEQPELAGKPAPQFTLVS